MHCTASTVHCPSYTVHPTRYNVHHALCTMHHAPCCMFYSPYTVYYAPHTMHHSLYTMQQLSFHCSLLTFIFSLHNFFYALLTIQYPTIHCSLLTFTIHSTRYTFCVCSLFSLVSPLSNNHQSQVSLYIFHYSLTTNYYLLLLIYLYLFTTHCSQSNVSRFTSLVSSFAFYATSYYALYTINDAILNFLHYFFLFFTVSCHLVTIRYSRFFFDDVTVLLSSASYFSFLATYFYWLIFFMYYFLFVIDVLLMTVHDVLESCLQKIH